MKRILLSLCAVLLMVISLMSCKPDIELTSDYKDVTVVYGLLNPLDRYQYIKIYKGYLTKDNALVWAKDLDNISYYDEIDVQLIEHRENGNVVTYPMDTVMSVSKNYGTFASPTQVLYRPVYENSHRPVPIREGCLYQLVITNKKTGRKVTSETTTIANMAFNIPLGTSQSISAINLNRDDPWSVGFKTNSWPENAYAVDAYVTFRYIEKDTLTGDTVHKAVRDIRVTPGFTAGNETSFKPNVIYRILHDNIEVNNNVWRFPDTYECIDIKLWACDQVYYTYYKTAQPSSSIVQDRVNYTNIETDDNMALGFFASRTYYKRTFKLDVINHNEDSLAHGQWTKNLNFRPYTDLLN
ncbi:MAG: hypothetical protein J6P65_07685 [Bacteroidales bacterium]|nr:hypothetical protein [Bacteroidales bacterium]